MAPKRADTAVLPVRKLFFKSPSGSTIREQGVKEL
jgi:hypothetical protein